MSHPLNTSEHQKLNHILVEQLAIKPEQIISEAKIVDDLGADSLAVIELSMTVEEQFNVTISDERLEQISTVGDLAAALAELLAEQSKQQVVI